MRIIHARRAGRYSPLAVLSVLVVAACGWDGAAGPTSGPRRAPSDAVGTVGISLGFSGSTFDGFLTVGDRDTILAQAYLRRPPFSAKFDSAREPSRFTYRSSDPQVATVGEDGVVVTGRPGTTILSATSEGIESHPLTLTVAPRARELRAMPEEIHATVGDTLALSITALDDSGAEVAGVVFHLSPDTTVWAVVSPPEGDWRMKTPRILHMRATRVGTVRLTAYSRNERATARLRTRPVLVTVRAR